MYVIANLLLGLVFVLNSVIFLYTILLIGAVIVSWVNADPYNPIVRFLHTATEPVLRRVRRYVPMAGGLDLSPLIVLLVLMFIERGILPSIATFAMSLQ